MYTRPLSRVYDKNRKSWGLKGGGPKVGGPNGLGPRVGARRVGPQNFARFSLSLGGSSRGIVAAGHGRRPPKLCVWVSLGSFCVSPGAGPAEGGWVRGSSGGGFGTGGSGTHTHIMLA